MVVRLGSQLQHLTHCLIKDIGVRLNYGLLKVSVLFMQSNISNMDPVSLFCDTCQLYESATGSSGKI